MYPGVIKVEATDEHKLILTFDNGECRLFDMVPYLHVGRYVELRDIDVFKLVSVSFDTVEWENGVDIDPEFLYAKSKQIVTPVGQRSSVREPVAAP
jgi:hypothetical protein